MKIGKLNFKDYAVKKPVMISASGEFLTVNQVATKASLGNFSLHTLSNENQKKLTLERYKLEPDFTLGIFELGKYTKAQLIDEIEKESDLGKLAIQVEMQYCNDMLGAVNAAKLPIMPEIPDKIIPVAPDWKQINRCFFFKLKTTVLFAENTTDSVTTPFASYRIAKVHPVFVSKGYNVVVNKDTNDTKINFETIAKKPLTVYVSGIGHGNYDVYTGHAGEYLLRKGTYDASVVKDKAFHFLSCKTAAQLGPDTITKGANCYMGYNENFTFVWDSPTTPINEVELFQKCDSTFDLYMANGFTAQQAYNATIACFNGAIAMVPGTTAASWLTYDRDHCKLHGIGTTKILPYRFVRICLPLKKLEQEEMLAEIGEFTE
jgi:hypothetical protein